MKKLFFLFVITSSLISAGQEDKTVCQKFAKPLEGGFCVSKATCNASNDYVYYLHGSGGSETQWQDKLYYTNQLRKQWSETGAAVPTIIAVSFGKNWLLTEKNSSPVSGLFEVFTQQVIPQVEAFIGQLKGRRLVFGESMGGFNSIQLALKSKLFVKAAALCSPMSEISPFSSPEEIDSYIKKSSAWNYYKDSEPQKVIDNINKALFLAQSFAPTPDDWQKADPLQLALKSDNSKLTSMYVADGFYDSYVSYEANEKFVQLLLDQSFNVEWRPQWGGHCAIDIPSLADFLTK